MRTWTEPPNAGVPADLRSAVGGHPLVAQTLARRGHSAVAAALAFLDPDRYTPTPGAALPGLSRAADRIEQAIRDQEPICVWGDFDVDGQSSTALLVGMLRDLGAHKGLCYHVPVRETESHGVNLPVLGSIIEAGARLVVTCDTGITAHEAVTTARSLGVDMVVTDHHQPPDDLPAAFAVVNPKLLPPGHPLYDLPGVGVAYKLAEELYGRSPVWGVGAAQRHLDLVALGIVADLAVQRRDTRYLLQQGLACLRTTRRPGLELLLESAGLDPAWISEEHIGYVLAPRLNAVGRLADAGAVVELLTLGEAPGADGTLSAADHTRARILVDQMEALNRRRKELCDQVYAAAEAQIARDAELQRAPVLVLANPSWPPGVIGIVAAQLVERYGKPAVLISAPPGQIARGSARSVEGCNITGAIAAQASLLAGFGGHPMAAGLSIEPDLIPQFARALGRTVAGMLGATAVTPSLKIDGYLPLKELSLSTVDDLARLAPFGPGNPPLTLVCTDLTVERERRVGRNAEHRLLTVRDAGGARAGVIWWDGAKEELPASRIDLAYAVRASNYRGERQVEIDWIDARPSAAALAGEMASARAPVQIVDCRREPAPLRVLEGLRQRGDLAVWREGPVAEVPGQDRYGLPRAAALAVWTAPPSPAELRAALAQVDPVRIYLFGIDPALDRPDLFARRLAGLVRHTLGAHEGRTTLAALAAACAQREATVLAGLEWLAARGDLELQQEGDGSLLLRAGQGPEEGPAQEAALAGTRRRMEALLAETAAYRTYFRTADAEVLMGFA
jgi:single-stranded-DNA-specific exonuclease